MPYSITEALYAEVDGVPLSTTAWSHDNLLELFRPPDKRGADGVVIPGAHGRRATPAWDDQSERIINLRVENHMDWEGNDVDDLRYGFIANVQHLKDNVVAPPGGAGTRSLVLHLGDEGDWGGPIIVMNMELDETNGAVSLGVLLPLGQVELGGS